MYSDNQISTYESKKVVLTTRALFYWPLFGGCNGTASGKLSTFEKKGNDEYVFNDRKDQAMAR